MEEAVSIEEQLKARVRDWLGTNPTVTGYTVAVWVPDRGIVPFIFEANEDRTGAFCAENGMFVDL